MRWCSVTKVDFIFVSSDVVKVLVAGNVGCCIVVGIVLVRVTVDVENVDTGSLH